MAEIEEVHGLLFNAETDWLVNTVNCVGVMGAGVALECKYRYSGLFEAYEYYCSDECPEDKRFKPGMLWAYTKSTPKILCIATKDDWHHPSKIQYVEDGLRKLAANYKRLGIFSIAIPHLGCSHGGLNWEDDVQPLVYKYLDPDIEEQSDLKVQVYSFDPDAQDDLYDQLVEQLRDLRRRLDDREIAAEIGFSNRRPCKPLFEAIDSGEINNMLRLQSVKDIGKKTMEAIYKYLTQRVGREHYSNSFIEFADDDLSRGSAGADGP